MSDLEDDDLDEDDDDEVDPQALWEFFDSGAVRRGLDCFRDGAVEKLDITENGEGGVLRARVQGHELYRTTVRIEGFIFEDSLAQATAVDSECTCPVGWACKHAVAAVAAWLEDQGIPAASGHPPSRAEEASPARPAVPAPTAWQPPALAPRLRLAAHCLGLCAPPPGEGTPVAYLLRYDFAASGLQHFVPMAVRWLERSQRWGVGKRADDAGSLAHKAGGELAPDDALLVNRLARLVLERHHGQSYHWRGDGWLHAGAGASGDLIERILATGRAFAGELTGQALTRGSQRTGRLAWMPEKGGALRLRVQGDDGKPMEVLPTDPPWYRDGGILGPLAIAGFAPEMAGLIDHPAVPAAVAATAAISWQARGVALPDPPGAGAAPKPEPVLLVAPAQWPTTWRGGRLVHGWRLEVAVPLVRYQGVLVPLGDAQPRSLPDGTPVVRDLPAEERLRGELAALGLIEPVAGGPRLESRDPHADELPLWHHRGQATAPPEGTTALLPAAVLAGIRLRGWEISGSAPQVATVDPQAWTMRVAEAADNDWFELHLGVEIGGEAVDLVPVLLPLIERGEAGWRELPLLPGAAEPTLLLDAGPGRALAVPVAVVERLRAALLDIAARGRGPGGGLRLDRADLAAIAGGALGAWSGSERVQTMAEALRACLQPAAVDGPAGFGLELRGYQREGLGWMLRLRALSAGGLLADDMGLGKTVQVLALIAHDRADGGGPGLPSLIVCPASMVGTWAREAARCVPGLGVVVHHGLDRAKAPDFPADALVVTTYATLVRDAQALAARSWHLVVCDEAQAMKNAGTRNAAAVRGLDARHRLCLTGTPVENHLGELHSYLDWLVPGLLGTRAGFDRGVRKAVEEGGDASAPRLAWLRRRIAPFLLRRTKEAVASELPPRTEIELPVEFGEAQRAAYEAVRLAMDARVQLALSKKGLARSHLEVLEALLALRQVCCDPRLAHVKKAAAAGSAKMEALSDLLAPLIEDGRRVLLFSTFTSFLDLIEAEVVKPLGVPHLRLDGSTPVGKRQELVERFQAGAAPLFLLSLKAGGTGLTLTAADTVVICDPWWNPAAEAQAADRAHRIGQDKPVTIYRLVCSGTVEERIRALQRRKQDLAAAIYGDDGQTLGRLEESDIAALLAPMERGEV